MEIMMRTVKPPKTYQLKISLKDVKPSVWRRIQLPGDTNLHQLHLILQVVMGWTNSHLHLFNIGPATYSDPDADEECEKNEAKFILSKVAPAEGMAFIYEYDFGDGWEHIVKVEKILFADERLVHPVCLAGKRACPPEDCGGPFGYMELLDTINDPESDNYDEMLDWIGEDFDSEHFDCKEINEMLSDPDAIKNAGID